jgi:hypothetical protein
MKMFILRFLRDEHRLTGSPGIGLPSLSSAEPA